MPYLPEGQLTQERRYEQAELSAACLTKKILWARAYLFDAARRLHFHLGFCEGIMPFEESALDAAAGSVRDIAVIGRVGRMTCFTVKEITANENDEPIAILSRAEAQQRCKDEYFDLLEPGDIIPATVTSIESFGAFCDVGCGLISLLPIDYLSVSRIRTPLERFSIGQNIYCTVRKRDEFGRLVLSMKELLGTWDENARRFAVGETVIGRVRGLESYGVFVEIAPNLAGLAELRQDVAIGDCVSVYIKSILEEKMKIKLIILSKLEQQLPPPELEYTRTDGHITRWNYASIASGREMETVFL